MTVEANIGYAMKIRHVSKEVIRKRVGELIDLVRLCGLEKDGQRSYQGQFD